MITKKLITDRDKFVADGLVYEKVNHVSETMFNAFDIDYHLADSLVAKNAHGMDTLLDRLSSKIGRKLLHDVTIDNSERFLIHYDIKVRQLKGGRTKRGEGKAEIYLPFTLHLSDGQVITALVKNTTHRDVFSGSKEVIVWRWALNNKDITDFIYIDGDRDIDSSVIANRLAKVANVTHAKFVSKNGKDEGAITKEKLDKLVVKYSEVVYDSTMQEQETAKAKKPKKPKEKIETPNTTATAEPVREEPKKEKVEVEVESNKLDDLSKAIQEHVAKKGELEESEYETILTDLGGSFIEELELEVEKLEESKQEEFMMSYVSTLDLVA